ncbi:hypothetical protein [Nonomuraea rubra]|uniref:hypothetical protein n=1 Tax=Nonomuraea rubra TaxID=46180 RepID=UPI0033FE40DC
MSELEVSRTGEAVAAAGGVLERMVRYTIIVGQLSMASVKLLGLSERVRGTYRYVEGCSTSTDRLAEQMASLTVDRDTVGEHHQAAAVMRSVLAAAEAMAADMEDLAGMFQRASDDHRAEYGPVADTAQSMPVPMAEAEFYSNR